MQFVEWHNLGKFIRQLRNDQTTIGDKRSEVAAAKPQSEIETARASLSKLRSNRSTAFCRKAAELAIRKLAIRLLWPRSFQAVFGDQ
jgi:hypothetical protein